jgi:hypothetical protein
MAKRVCPPGFVRLTFALPDQDSTMHSSPSMAADDEMFPDEALPSTPRNATSHALATSSELSPPNSQPPANLPRGDSFSATIASNVNENGKRPLSLNPAAAVASETASGANGLTHADPETGYQWSRAEDQPGYEWKCQRAREEEMRALDQIVDKGSQIKSECG